jgi:hypothetical protein
VKTGVVRVAGIANGSIGGQAIRALLLGRRAFSQRVTHPLNSTIEEEHLPIVTCGIDCAQDHHDIAIVDADGRLIAIRRVPESVAGFTELTAMLADAGDDPEDPIPVGIETPRGLLVAVLRATGRPVYPINPMSVAR